VLLEFPDGRSAAGVLIQEQGEILTAGHVVIGPGQPARVRLANGTELAAKTLGVAREFDLGLLDQPTARPQARSGCPGRFAAAAGVSGDFTAAGGIRRRGRYRVAAGLPQHRLDRSRNRCVVAGGPS
jgi:hypothetical protein